MDVKVIRVVVNPVGIANRVRRMKALVELRHDVLRRGLQHAVGIDSGFNELVVQLARHRENEAMLNDGILRGGRKFRMCPNHASEIARLAFVVGKLRRRGAAAVLVDQDQLMQESARVNLTERFLRRRGKKSIGSNVRPISELGITKTQSSRWQRAAVVPLAARRDGDV
jgi:hypothetical protein